MIFVGLSNKPLISLSIMQKRNPIFTLMSNGDIRNSYAIRIENKSNKNKVYALEINGLKNYVIKNQDNINLKEISILVGDYYDTILHVIIPNGDEDSKKITFIIIDNESENKITKENIFISR